MPPSHIQSEVSEDPIRTSEALAKQEWVGPNERKNDEGTTRNYHSNGTRRRERRWRAHARRRRPKKKCPSPIEDPRVLCLTQNVRGLLKNDATIDEWLDGLRLSTDLGFIDLAMLQETRATPRWRKLLSYKYAAGWGLVDESWSFWGPTQTAAGGVAILVRPGGRITNPRPLWEHLWSPWLVAIQFEVSGIPYAAINFYGASEKTVREETLLELGRQPKPNARVILGGDFNCTLDDELDRSLTPRHSHDSPALHELLRVWEMRDAIQNEIDSVRTESDRRAFHATHHTYRYAVGDDQFASSRLDRFYIEHARRQHVREVTTSTPASSTDHDGVLLAYADRASCQYRPQRNQRARLRYPLPFGMTKLVKEISETHIQLLDSIAEETPAVSAAEWTKWKPNLLKSVTIATRMKSRTHAKAYRQRKQRIQKALKAQQPATNSGRSTIPATVEGITKGLASLAINSYSVVKALRAELIMLNRQRGRARRHKRRAQYANGAADLEKATFRRYRPPRLKTQVEPGQATRIATAWRIITQRGDRPAKAREIFLASLPPLTNLPDLSLLDAEFTEAEVRAAIRSCPRDKAPGPDGIPNNWYRDNEDLLVRPLTKLYNGWHTTGILPTSFRKALVACIPKTTKPKSGLDYRPIALLDSDYKIYSRLLLNRLRPHMSNLVSDTQFGFVQGKQVHDALDVFHALQALVQEGLAPASGLAVCLDFAKAYDTLDRPFLIAVLKRLGCPPKFRHAVQQMHLATTSEYLIGNETSAEEHVLNGIRQGCPLAPTLFVLAVDTLYQAANANVNMRGIQLPSAREIKVAGFADDTTVYVKSEADVPPLLELLRTFEAASGLGINKSKTVVVALHGQHRPQLQMDLPLAAATDWNRLLGGQIASDGPLARVWELTVQQMKTRLRTAETKTSNVLQRVKLVNAILVPKFLFVARHHWPTSHHIAKVQRLIKNFVWHGTLSDEQPTRRAWMNEDVAALPQNLGGIGMPVLTHTLQVLSVRVVARWATPNGGLRTEIGRIRLRHHKAPTGTVHVSRRDHLKPTLQSTMAGTGLQLHQALESLPRQPDEIALVTALLRDAGRGHSDTHEWQHGSLIVDYSARDTELGQLRELQRQRYGRLQYAALLKGPACGEDILLGRDGLPLVRSHFAGLISVNSKIGDVVQIEKNGPGRLKFTCRVREYPLPDAQARAFKTFCDVLVANYPAILLETGQTGDLVPVGPHQGMWSLVKTAHAIELWWSPIAGVMERIGAVTSTMQASRMARHLSGDTLLRFVPHAWLDSVYRLWWSPIRHEHSTPAEQVGATRTERGLRDIDERENRWASISPQIAAALETLDWDEILKIPGAPSSHCLLMHRLKSLRISGWSAARQAIGCTHCPEVGSVGGRPDHIFWSCPRATGLWSELRRRWDSLSDHANRPTDEQFLRNVFTMRLEKIPTRLWSSPSMRRLPTPTAAHTTATHMAVQAAWRFEVLATLHSIWKWRIDAESPEEIWPRRRAQAYHDGCLRAALRTPRWPRSAESAASCHAAAAIELVRAADPDRDYEQAEPTAPDTRYLLFFDGGSRGNPGPGGSGAVIVRTSQDATQASIIWSAAMTLAGPTTTNNQAEYTGVVTGLRAAADNRWFPLDVIGDSQLIIGQLRRYRAPTNPRLLELYAEARRIADSIGVSRWAHHLRHFNKMADAAANLAMDNQASSQVFHPTTRPGHADLVHHLGQHFCHWQTSHFVDDS